MKNKIKRFTAKTVDTNSDFEGRDMNWNEVYQGSTYSKKDDVFYHKSSRLIKKFQTGIHICTHPEEPYCTAAEVYDQGKMSRATLQNECTYYVYRITVPKGTELEIFDENERRIEVTHDMNIELHAVVDTYRIADEDYDYRTGNRTINVWRIL